MTHGNPVQPGRVASRAVTDLRHLTRPLTGFWAWQLLGACRQWPAELFFHPQGERGPDRAERERNAKDVCSGCTVRVECLAHAVANREPYGVWAEPPRKNASSSLSSADNATAAAR